MELRWGTNGARCVDIAKGTWFDHEAKQGGGVIDLLKREGFADPWAWLREHGFGNASDGRGNKQRKIVATYDYADETGTLLFQVVRYDHPKTSSNGGRTAGAAGSGTSKASAQVPIVCPS